MGREKRGPLALEAWARMNIDGYPNVSVNNMTTSWRNGLAFCALIHRFRPDLIEYEKLDPADVLGNCSLAFETAESKLGIPALLDPEDMAAHDVPDRLSVLTYVAQFYSLFKNAEKKSTLPLQGFRREKDDVDLKTRSSDKSTTPNSEKTETSASSSTTSTSLSTTDTQNTIPSSPNLSSSSVSAAKRRFETLSSASQSQPSPFGAKRAAFLAPPPCSKCQNPVYISERTVFLKKLYHRKCFLCHGCGSMLNPHTADVSADGTAFFCISKSCQLELLKLNRSTLGGGGDAGSNMSTNESPLSKSNVAITDPSLLVRNSIVSASKSSLGNNGQNYESKISSNENDNESKENVVPSPGMGRNVILRSSEHETNVGAPLAGEADDGDRNISTVSRLTARFECVQQNEEDDIRSKNTTSAHPTITIEDKPIDGDSSNHIHDDIPSKPETEYSNESASNKSPSINVSPIRPQEGEENHSNNELTETSTGSCDKVIADDNGNVIADEEMLPHSNNLKIEDSTSIKADSEKNEDAEKLPTELDNARSNWLRGQIQNEGTEKDVPECQDAIIEGSEQIPVNRQDTPKVIISESQEDAEDEDRKYPEKVEYSNEVEVESSDPPSLEFKLAETDKENGAAREEGNNVDSGISGINSIIDSNNVAVTITSTSEETDPKDRHIATESNEVEKKKLGDESTFPESVPANNSPEGDVISDIETDNEPDSEKVVAPATANEISPADVNDSQNPFEEEDKEEKLGAEKESQDTDSSNSQSNKESEKDPIVAENDNATLASEVLPEEKPKPTDTVPSTELPSPKPTQEDTTMKDRLTPTPRKKKRAPQPLAQHSHSHDPVPQPVPSPRARYKSRYSMQTPSSSTNLKNGSSSKLDEYPAELNPFDDDEAPVVGKPPPSPKPRPKSTLPSATSVNPFGDDEESSNKSSQNAEGNSKKDNHVNGSLPPKPKPMPRTSTPKPYNPFEDEEDDIGNYGEDDKPTGLFARGSHDDTSSISSKTSGLSDTSGVTGMGFSSSSHLQKSFNASDISSQSGSTRLRSRKSRRAPLPPGMGPPKELLKPGEPTTPTTTSSLTAPPSPKKVIPVSPELKVIKAPGSKVQYRKKRRAPPPKRRVEPLPEEQIKTELTDLEVKQKELERQGISLEGNIRQIMCQEEEENKDSAADTGNSEQLDEMIIQLWNIVNEKNDILRRQTELEYLRRSHRLEEMQSELEFQLRILMDTPEDQRAAEHARTEQLLLDELLKLVDERNEVVDWLDYYRQMDREEELHVNQSIKEFKHHGSLGIAEMVSQLKQKAKKDKSKKEEKAKKGSSKPSKTVKSTDDPASASDSTSSKSKKKDGKPSVLGVFSTLRKKTKKHKSVIDEDKDIDESSAIKK